MSQFRSFEAKIAQLSAGSDDSQLAARQLAEIASNGLKKTEFDTLFLAILDHAIPTNTRNYVIKHALIPADTYRISHYVLYRVVGSVGTTEIYSKLGKLQKLKVVSTSTQQALLEWLLCLLHLFEEDAYVKLHRMLPMLMNLLSFEFLRLHISNLIFIAIVNTKSSAVHAFKPWHVKLVADLHRKFPLDQGLRCLLVLFCLLHPGLDLAEYGVLSAELGSIDPKTFRYPNIDFLERLRDIQLEKSAENVALNLSHYRNFASVIRKRRRTAKSVPVLDLDMIEVSANNKSTSINDITSPYQLVNDLERIRYINVNGLFKPLSIASPSEKFKKLFLVLQGLLGNSEALRKLEYYVRLSLLDDNLSLADLDELCDQVRAFLMFSSGKVHLDLVNDFIKGNLLTRAHDASSTEHIQKHRIMVQILKLFRFLSIPEPTEFKNCVIDRFLSHFSELPKTQAQRERYETLTVSFLSEMANVFSIWYKTYAEEDERLLGILNLSLPDIFAHCALYLSQFTVKMKLLLFQLFKFLMAISDVQLNKLKPAALLPPPALFYGLLTTLNPFIVSELCGYLAHIKKGYNFVPEGLVYHLMRNAYVMDTLNFLWRDKAFSHDSGSAKGLMLHEDLIHKLGTLSMFNYSGVISVQTAGNFFHNPCFLLISGEIVWRMEDENEATTTRLEGPVTEESVHRVNGQWLRLLYDEVKLQVLRRLDQKYLGLGDLLFSLLKTLAGSRGK